MSEQVSALWRAFIGEPDYRTLLDVSGLSWEEARRRLLAELAEDYPDSGPVVCGHCEAAARAAREGLRDLPPGTPGQWDVDRDTYALSASADPAGSERRRS